MAATSALIDSLLASERKQAPLDTFHLQYHFKDGNSAFPTDIVATNSTFSFVDGVASQYWKVKNAYPFPQGFAIFRSKQLGSSRFEPTEYNKVGIFPLHVLLSYFSEGPSLAAAMEGKAAELYENWHRKNAHLPAEARQPENLTYILDGHAWPNENGVIEQSFCELELTNYWAAKESLQSESTELTLDDINVVMRIRSTLYDGASQVAAGSTGDDNAKLYSKGMGYVVPIRHFVNLLRDPELKVFCENVSSVVAKAAPMQPPPQLQQQQQKRSGTGRKQSLTSRFYGKKPPPGSFTQVDMPTPGWQQQASTNSKQSNDREKISAKDQHTFSHYTQEELEQRRQLLQQQEQQRYELRQKRAMEVDPSDEDGNKKQHVAGTDETG